MVVPACLVALNVYIYLLERLHERQAGYATVYDCSYRIEIQFFFLITQIFNLLLKL